MFQSESNLGLLWGHQGLSGPVARPRWFQSESNLGLLWGVSGYIIAKDPDTSFNPNQISAYYGGYILARLHHSVR